MELKNFFAQDDQGNKLPGATCYLYQRGSESPAAGAVKANGGPLGFPFTADNNGLIQLAAPNGLYDLRVTSSGRDYRIQLQFNDVSESIESVQAAALQAVVARDAAQLSAGVKDDVAQGLLTTVSGQYFSVPSPDSGEYLILYHNRDGVAVERKRYPSADSIDQRGRFEEFDGKHLLKWLSPIRRLLMAIRLDGTLVAKLGISLGVSNGLRWARGADGIYTLSLGDKDGVLPVGQAVLDASDEGDRWLHVFRTPARRWLMGILRDGSTRIAKLDHPVMAGSANSDRFFVRSERDGAGWYQLKAFDRQTGKLSAITSGAVPIASSTIVANRYLVYAAMPDQAVKYLARDLVLGEDVPLDALEAFSLWGDSLTAPGTGYGDTFAALVPGYSVSIEGIGGHRIAQIAARMGAVTNSNNNVTVTGGIIPASGAVNCSANYLVAGPPTDTKSVSGTLAGVAGVLKTSTSAAASVTTTFTRSVDGEAVNVATPALFVPTAGISGKPLKDLRSRINVIYAGANDIGKSDYDQAFVLARIEDMVANLRAVCPRFVILGLTNGWGNLPASQGGTRADDATSKQFMDQIAALNAALKTRYGELFFDTHAKVVAANPGYSANYVVGVKTYQVLTATVISDGIHYTTTGKTTIANALISFITDKGWFQ